MAKLLKFFAPFFFLFFVFVSFAPRALAAEPTQRVIVVFKQPQIDNEAIKITSQYQARWKRPLRLIRAAAIELPTSAIEALKNDPNVLRVDQDVIVQALDQTTFNRLASDWCSIFPFLSWCNPNSSHRRPKPTPTPTLRPTPTPTPAPGNTQQPIPWGVSQIQAPQVWPTTHGSGIKVAIIDTGAQVTHPDLAGNIVGCISFVSYTTSCNDDNGHGTHVSGIVAALDNSIGVVGVAPQTSLYELKVLDNKGSGYLSDIISALDWAKNNGIQVVNMSLGTTSDIQSFRDAVTAAYNAGAVEVAAAGNSGPGSNTVLYPGGYPEVIGVAATDNTNNVPSWSSRGPQIAVAAPGVNIYSTYPTNTYTYLSGTSMASPHVAGVVALRKQLHPGETPSSVKTLIQSTATPLPYANTVVGSGLVNAYNFVTAP